MRRAEALVALAIPLGLGGCMRIYPDPELPDIEVSWIERDCRDGTGEVVLALVGIDDGSRLEVTVPCRDLTARFDDLARLRYRLEGTLLDTEGEVFTSAEAEVDLRDGISERPSLYFGGFANVRVRWTFDMEATCASLGATATTLHVQAPGNEPAFVLGAPCEATRFLGTLTGGAFTMHLRALAGEAVVAVSAETAEFTVAFPALTDLGVLVLSPCGKSCP